MGGLSVLGLIVEPVRIRSAYPQETPLTPAGAAPRRDPAPQPVTDKNVRLAAPSREVNFPQRVGVCADYTKNRRSDRASGGQLRSDRSRSAGKSVDFCSRLLDVLHKSGLSPPQETRSPGAVKPSGSLSAVGALIVEQFPLVFIEAVPAAPCKLHAFRIRQ